MRCDEASGLDALADGELSGREREEFAGHLRGCAACRDDLEALGRMGREVRRARLRCRPALRTRISRALDAEERRSAADLAGRGLRARLAGLAPRGRPLLVQAATLAAACLLTALLTWSIVRRTEVDLPVSDAFSAHLRGLLQDSPVQIASTDQHVVKPWFVGRLTFAPVVKELSAEGFPLAGGRVDVIDQERVAALVYRRRLHAITVFLRPGAATEEPRLSRVKGYSVISWAKDGLSYWMVSDLNEAELFQLQALL